MLLRDTRILFFTKGRSPTDEEYQTAHKLSSNVGFRYKALWRVTDGPEALVAAIAGDIPEGADMRYLVVKSKADMDALDKRIEAGEKPGPIIDQRELTIPSWNANA